MTYLNGLSLIGGASPVEVLLFLIKGTCRTREKDLQKRVLLKFMARQGVVDFYNQGENPQLGNAVGLAQRASNMGLNTGRFYEQADMYMNPYRDDILEQGSRRLTTAFQTAMGDAGGRASDAAVQAGVIGGRGNLLRARDLAATTEEHLRGMKDFETEVNFGAWDQARQAFAQDEQNRLAGARIGLDASSRLESLAQTQQAQTLERLGALQRAGLGERELEQAARDLAYNNFLERRDWQLNQLKEHVGILSGTPLATAMNSYQTTSGGGPGAGQILGGLGIASLGAVGSYYGAQV
jgi:hypothetical protein